MPTEHLSWWLMPPICVTHSLTKRRGITRTSGCKLHFKRTFWNYCCLSYYDNKASIEFYSINLFKYSLAKPRSIIVPAKSLTFKQSINVLSIENTNVANAKKKKKKEHLLSSISLRGSLCWTWYVSRYCMVYAWEAKMDKIIPRRT